MIIAIDGPAGSGKSTTAKLIAQKLGFLHLGTGAMYRAVTVFILRNNISNSNLKNHTEIESVMDNIHVDFSLTSGRVLLNEIDVSTEIRRNIVSENVSRISAIPQVRERMVIAQRSIAQGNNVVLEGRDIGTRVFPDADYKFYLNADLIVRGNRRYKELLKQGVEISLEQVLLDIKHRDHKDSTRKHSPLKKAEDAIEIDTTHLTIHEQADEIVTIINI